MGYIKNKQKKRKEKTKKNKKNKKTKKNFFVLPALNLKGSA